MHSFETKETKEQIDPGKEFLKRNARVQRVVTSLSLSKSSKPTSAVPFKTEGSYKYYSNKNKDQAVYAIEEKENESGATENYTWVYYPLNKLTKPTPSSSRYEEILTYGEVGRGVGENNVRMIGDEIVATWFEGRQKVEYRFFSVSGTCQVFKNGQVLTSASEIQQAFDTLDDLLCFMEGEDCERV